MQVSKQGHLLLFQEADVALHALDLMLQGHGIHGNPGLGPTWVEDNVEAHLQRLFALPHLQILWCPSHEALWSLGRGFCHTQFSVRAFSDTE